MCSEGHEAADAPRALYMVLGEKESTEKRVEQKKRKGVCTGRVGKKSERDDGSATCILAIERRAKVEVDGWQGARSAGRERAAAAARLAQRHEQSADGRSVDGAHDAPLAPHQPTPIKVGGARAADQIESAAPACATKARETSESGRRGARATQVL
eukprot:2813760-Pleurochrysis_carterae.AAC.1